MTLPTPLFDDGRVRLYHGDALELMPMLGRVDAIVTDPPYSVTHLEWDTWPDGWPGLASRLTDQLWCFGSLRVFLERAADFALAGWRLAQDIVWEKHNGSNSAADRFRRVHELAAHFIKGPWSSLYRSPQFTPDATPRQVRRKKRPTQWGSIGENVYTSRDGGPRHMRSVIRARSCHGYATNETQKPEAIVSPLVAFSVPVGGVVLDPFAGSGTTLAVARRDGRRAIGIERRLEQCEDIVRRLTQLDLDLAPAPGDHPNRVDVPTSR